MAARKKPSVSFEEKLKNLSQIVERVEDAETPLETAISLYKDGIALAKECGEVLRCHEEEILTLKKESGGFVLASFSEGAV